MEYRYIYIYICTFVCTGFYFYLDLHLILDPATQSDYSSHIGQSAYAAVRTYVHTSHLRTMYDRGHNLRLIVSCRFTLSRYLVRLSR